MNECICGCVDEMERKVKPQTKQTQSNHTDINQINPVSQQTQTYTDSNDNETDNNKTHTNNKLSTRQPTKHEHKQTNLDTHYVDGKEWMNVSEWEERGRQ